VSVLLKRGLTALRNFFAQHPLPAAFPSREKVHNKDSFFSYKIAKCKYKTNVLSYSNHFMKSLHYRLPLREDKSWVLAAMLNTHCLRHFPRGKTSDTRIRITSVAFVKTRFSDVTELLCATPIACGISLKGKVLLSYSNHFIKSLHYRLPLREETSWVLTAALNTHCLRHFPQGKRFTTKILFSDSK